MQRKSFIVTTDIPEGTTVRGVEEYIREAIGSWAGQYQPPGAEGEDDIGNPYFQLNGAKVTVRPCGDK